jgi:adenylosuccinate synthase
MRQTLLFLVHYVIQLYFDVRAFVYEKMYKPLYNKFYNIKESEYYSICGLMFGDEGKGKLVDAIIQRGIQKYGNKNTIVCGLNGGSNAGHTTSIDGVDYHTHFLPSGAVSDGVILYCGSSKVLEPISLSKELNELSVKFKNIPQRTYLSELIQFTTLGHLIIDGGELGKVIGTTGKGIGITYATKCTRKGLTLYDIVNSTDEELMNSLKKLYDSLGLQNYPHDVVLYSYTLNGQQINIYRDDLYNFKYDLENIHNFRETWPNIVPSTYFKNNLLHNTNHCYILESSNAIMLDTTHGSYPNVTSSSCSPNSITDSLSINLKNELISKLIVVGVVKSYITRVGMGSLPTDMTKGSEEDKERARIIVEKGKEYGVTTGRMRTPGWLDIPALKYATYISTAKYLNITRLDNFSNIDKIKVCIGYSNYNDEDNYPALENKMALVKPVYIEMDGWKDFDFSRVKTYNDLHQNVRNYIEFIEEQTKTKVWAINTGKGRDQIIYK